MDKRLFLAFVLSGLVVVATPFLFPRPKAPPTPVTAPATESSAVAVPGGATGVSPTSPASGSATGVATQAGKTTPMAVATATVPAASATVAETLTVNTSVQHIRFSTLGATPLDVELPNFRNLGATKGEATIHQRSEPLLR